MRIFKLAGFARFAAKEGITDGELSDIVGQLEAGYANADLSGGVYKMRVARSGEGKSGGYRVIVYFKNGERSFFQYGFAKSVRDNIGEKELKVHKQTAKYLLALNDKQLDDLVKTGKYIEV
jgi:hypothetical protein